MQDALSGHIFNDVMQVLTALGVILTAVSSIVNRKKLSTVEMKVDRVVIVASKTKKENVAQTEEVKRVVLAAKEEVKEVIKNGKQNG